MLWDRVVALDRVCADEEVGVWRGLLVGVIRTELVASRECVGVGSTVGVWEVAVGVASGRGAVSVRDGLVSDRNVLVMTLEADGV